LEYIGYVYKITNEINDKMYVGQTIKPIAARLNTHFSKYSRCARLKSAIAKYGKRNFRIDILAQFSAETLQDLTNVLNKSEVSWISYLETLFPKGYNLTAGGDRASMCKESRDKSVEKHKKPVICVETGQTWPSVKDCADYFDVKPKQISRILTGERKRLKWAYTFFYLPKQSYIGSPKRTR
jgi:hypothetical protein